MWEPGPDSKGRGKLVNAKEDTNPKYSLLDLPKKNVHSLSNTCREIFHTTRLVNHSRTTSRKTRYMSGKLSPHQTPSRQL